MPKCCQSQYFCDVTEEVRARFPLFDIDPPVLSRCALNESLCVRSLDDDVVAQVPERLKVVLGKCVAEDNDTGVWMKAQGAFDCPSVPKRELLGLCRPCEEEVCRAPSSVESSRVPSKSEKNKKRTNESQWRQSMRVSSEEVRGGGEGFVFSIRLISFASCAIQ